MHLYDYGPAASPAVTYGGVPVGLGNVNNESFSMNRLHGLQIRVANLGRGVAGPCLTNMTYADIDTEMILNFAVGVNAAGHGTAVVTAASDSASRAVARRSRWTATPC